VSRPDKRFGRIRAYGEVDESRGEFWVESPWTYPPDRNLSAYEPNRVLLNTTGTGKEPGIRLVDVSLVSGAGDVADGRGVLVLDVNGDLAPDLAVRHAGGGPLTVYRNEFPAAARLRIELVGDESNRRGLGALVVAEIGERRWARQMWTPNNFLAQQGAAVRFGFGDPGTTKRVDRLTVHWPSGQKTVLENVRVNRSLRIHERDGEVEELR